MEYSRLDVILKDQPFGEETMTTEQTSGGITRRDFVAISSAAGMAAFIAPSVLGAQDTSGTGPHSGYLAHAMLWNTPLTAAQILQLATVP